MINKNKKIISELKQQICDLETEILEKDNEIARLKGDRICSSLCENCFHAIKNKYNSGFMGFVETYSCELDNRCKDFQRK